VTVILALLEDSRSNRLNCEPYNEVLISNFNSFHCIRNELRQVLIVHEFTLETETKVLKQSRCCLATS